MAKVLSIKEASEVRLAHVLHMAAKPTAPLTRTWLELWQRTSSDMITDLLAKVESAETSNSTVATLEAKLNSEISQHAATAQNAEESAAQLKEVRREADQSKSRCEALCKELDACRAEVANLNTELSARPYQEEVAALTAEVAALKQSSSDAVPAATPEADPGSAAALARATGEANALRRRSEDLQKVLTDKTGELQRTTTQLAEANSLSSQRQTAVDELQAKLDDKIRTLATSQSTLESLQSARSEDLAKIAALQTQLSEQQTASGMNSSKTTELETQLKARDADVADLNKKVAEYQRELSAATAELQENRRSSAVSLASAGEVQGQVATLEDQLERMRKKSEAKNKDVLELRDKVVECVNLAEYPQTMLDTFETIRTLQMFFHFGEHLGVLRFPGSGAPVPGGGLCEVGLTIQLWLLALTVIFVPGWAPPGTKICWKQVRPKNLNFATGSGRKASCRRRSRIA